MANTCIISGAVISGTGAGVTGVLVFARPYQIGTVHAQLNAFISQDVISSVTDSNGLFTISLLKNVEYVISIPVIGFKKKILVPDQDTCTLEGLISAPITGESPSGGNTNW